MCWRCFDDRIARYKHPREIRFADALPRTALGKVMRSGSASRPISATAERIGLIQDMGMSLKIGIDVGGTFTDFIVSGDGRETLIHKVLSTPDDPSIAVLDGPAAKSRRC